MCSTRMLILFGKIFPLIEERNDTHKQQYYQVLVKLRSLLNACTTLCPKL